MNLKIQKYFDSGTLCLLTIFTNANFCFFKYEDLSQNEFQSLETFFLCEVRYLLILEYCALLFSTNAHLGVLSFCSLIATNAARYRIATGPRKVQLLEFGLRRAQGPDGGLSASKYAYVGEYTDFGNFWQFLAIFGNFCHFV